MPDTTFSPGTIVTSTWLNEVNDTVFDATSGRAGTVDRTQISHNSDMVSVKDYGAKGDGSNDTPYFDLALASGLPIYVPPGTYYLTKNYSVNHNFYAMGGVTWTHPSNFRVSFRLNVFGNTKSRIMSSQSTLRQELQLYSTGDSFDNGSTGSGIHLYGNQDNEHAGNMAVLTGQDNDGTARMIILGGCSNTGSGGYRPPEYIDPDDSGSTFALPNDTRIVIGNEIFDYTDTNQATAMLTLKNPRNRPALHFVECDSAAEGEISVPTGEVLSMGHWSGTTYTPRIAFQEDGRLLVGGPVVSYVGEDTNVPQLQVHGLTQSTAGMGMFNYSNTATSDARYSFMRSRSSVVGTHTIMQPDDQLGTIVWSGSDGTKYIRGAQIVSFVDGVTAADAMPTRLSFWTTPVGSATPAEGLRISENKMLRSFGGVTVKKRAVVSAAGTTVLTDQDHFIVVTGTTTQTLTLPAATDARQLFIKNRSTGTVTVNRAGSDTIDGGTTLSLTAGKAATLIANTADWCAFNSA